MACDLKCDEDDGAFREKFKWAATEPMREHRISEAGRVWPC